MYEHIIDYYTYYARQFFNVRDIAIHIMCVKQLRKYYKLSVKANIAMKNGEKR